MNPTHKPAPRSASLTILVESEAHDNNPYVHGKPSGKGHGELTDAPSVEGAAVTGLTGGVTVITGVKESENTSDLYFSEASEISDAP